MKKNCFLILLLASFMLTACQSEGYETGVTHHPRRYQLEEVVKSTDLIINGAIIKKTDEARVEATDSVASNNEDYYDTFSTYQVSVERVYKGFCNDEQIVIKVFGQNYLEAGQGCILLLDRSSNDGETVYYPSYKVGILLPDESGNYSNRSIINAEPITPDTLPAYLEKIYSDNNK